MMQTQSHAGHQSYNKKSTNVRSRHVGLQTTRLGLRALGHLSPDLAARTAMKLAFRVRRFPRPEWEQALLDRAEWSDRIPWRDGQLAIWSWGRGPVVVLMHGWEGRGAQLGRFVDPLVARGFRVLAFDGPGHGDSTVSRGSMPDQAEALRRIAGDIGPLHGVVAHSMGAASTILAAHWGQSVGRMVLMASPTDARDWFDTVQSVLALDDIVTRRMVGLAERMMDRPIAELHITPHARRLSNPTLLVHDREDREVPVSHSRELAEALSDAELLVTEGLGHRGILRDPGVVGRVVAFLER